MPQWSLEFASPWLLLWATLLPVFWWVGRQSLSALGTWRRWFALSLRMLVAGILILALAEPSALQHVRRLAVLFLFDRSASMPGGETELATQYINQAVATQRNSQREDEAGVIGFGRDASIEVPLLPENWTLRRFEAPVDPNFTDLESALRMAQTVLPDEGCRRVVILSDGNQNLGQAHGVAEQLLADGIGIDVVPIRYHRQGDVAIEKIVAPSETEKGKPYDIRVVVNNRNEAGQVPGTLRITQTVAGDEQLLSQQEVTLRPGKQVFTLRQTGESSGFFTYEARFVPADAEASDQLVHNNQATAFHRVRGSGRVLLIEDSTQPGQYADFIRLLTEQKIDVTVRPSSAPFNDLAELQQFDSVILADVPRVTGEGVADIVQFRDDQIRMLVQNTERFGSGLIVLGGPQSYGAGGWTGSELEKALPVDFQIKNKKVVAVGALVLVIDSSGSMSGDKISMSKSAAVAAARMLGPRDYVGVVAFDSAARWVAPLERYPDKDVVAGRIGRLAAGGGTDMMPGMRQGYQALQNVNASVKHMIVLTDGQTHPGNFTQIAGQMAAQGITTTTVAVGPDSARQLMGQIAAAGGGKFYHVDNAKVIPRIFMREARRVAMPLVYENARGFRPQVVYPGEALSGIDEPIPPLTGCVMTTLKSSPLVELQLAAPSLPQENSTILATWQFGLGRAAALTTDIGQRWATPWKEWAGYEKLLTQLVRWSMRGEEERARAALATEWQGEQVHVVVSSLEPGESLWNGLAPTAAMVGPDGEATEVRLREIASGRFVADVPTTTPGNYYLAVEGPSGGPPLRAGVHVPYTPEFDRTESNEALLASLAGGTPRGGQAGQVIESPRGLQDTPELLATDVFRPDLAAQGGSEPLWPMLLLVAGCMFFLDVGCRRVSPDWGAMREAAANKISPWLFWRREEEQDHEQAAALERLKSHKQQATAAWTSLAPANDSDSTVATEGTVATELQEAQSAPPPRVERPDDVTPLPDAQSQASFTERLLKAKREASRRDEKKD